MALVGEPASGSVDHFGSVRSAQLPNSRPAAGVSSKYIDLGELLDADAGRGWSPWSPDVTAAQTMADTLAGRDSAVEWLLSHPQRLEPRAYPEAPLTRGRLAALLWQAAGSPAAEGTGFSDVLGIEWFPPALRWARESGAASRNGGGAFRGSPARDAAGGGCPAPPHRRASGAGTRTDGARRRRMRHKSNHGLWRRCAGCAPPD